MIETDLPSDTVPDSDTSEQVVVLSREEALELIPNWLIAGNTGIATELSELIAHDSKVDSSLIQALEQTLHRAVKDYRYVEGVAHFEARDLGMNLSSELHRLAGICYGWSNQPHLARHHFLTARRLGSPLAVLDLADLEYRDLRPVVSLRWLEEAVAHGCNSVPPGALQHRLGLTCAALGDVNRARTHFRQAMEELETRISERTQLVQVLLDAAQLELRAMRFHSALELCERARILAGDGTFAPLVRIQQKWCLLALGIDPDEEINFAFHEILDPAQRAEALIGFAWFTRGMNASEESQRYCSAAINLCSAHGLSALRLEAIVSLIFLAFDKLTASDLKYYTNELASLIEPGAVGVRVQALQTLIETFLSFKDQSNELFSDRLDEAIRALETLSPSLELGVAFALRAELCLALGRLERGRRDALRFIGWWERASRTPLIGLVLKHTLRLDAYMRRSGDAKLKLLYVHLNPGEHAQSCVLRLVTLTARPGLLLEQRPIPLGNQHIVPLLAYLCARGSDGASIAELGRDLYPELRGERLRNRVKNARIELRSEVASDVLSIHAEGGTRSMRLHLELGKGVLLEWDLEEFDRALSVGESDWVWLLSGYRGAFLEAYDEGNENSWVETTRERLHVRLLERAAHLIGEWFAAGRLEDLRSLVAMLSEREILDPGSPLSDAIAAFDVRATGTLLGLEAAMAVWAMQRTRFRVVYADSPILDALRLETFF